MATLQTGLGKGLDGLIRNTQSAADIPGMVLLPADDISPNPRQPRRAFPTASLEELAASIRSQGLLQPLLVRPSGTAHPGKYEIVAGERRWRACKLAGLTEIPAVIHSLSEQDTLVAALIENLQREDLNPMEEAFGFQSLKLEFSLSQEEIAQKLGKSRSAVANSLRLLTLPENIRALLAAGTLSAGHAKALLGIDDAGAREKLKTLILERHLSVREAEGLAVRWKESGRFTLDGADRTEDAPASPGAPDDPANDAPSDASGPKKRGAVAQSAVLMNIQTRIASLFSVPVKVTGKEEKGRISFVYNNKEELEALVLRLSARIPDGQDRRVPTAGDSLTPAGRDDPGLLGTGDSILDGRADPSLGGRVDPVLAGRDDLGLDGRADPSLDGRTDPVLAGRNDLRLDGRADPPLEGRADPVLTGKDDLGLDGRADPILAGRDDPGLPGKGDPFLDGRNDPALIGSTVPALEEKNYADAGDNDASAPIGSDNPAPAGSEDSSQAGSAEFPLSGKVDPAPAAGPVPHSDDQAVGALGRDMRLAPEVAALPVGVQKFLGNRRIPEVAANPAPQTENTSSPASGGDAASVSEQAAATDISAAAMTGERKTAAPATPEEATKADMPRSRDTANDASDEQQQPAAALRAASGRPDRGTTGEADDRA
jgi:ParB family chromosome partitioning protein